MFCNKCGQELKDEMQFCIKCGNNVRNLSIKTEALSERESKVTVDESLNESVKGQIKNTTPITKKDFLKNCSPKVKSWIKKSWILYYISLGLTVAFLCLFLVSILIAINTETETMFNNGELVSEGIYRKSLDEDFEMPESFFWLLEINVLARYAVSVTSLILGAVTCKTKNKVLAILYCIFSSVAAYGIFLCLPFAIPILVFMCKIDKEYKFFAKT